MRRSARLGEVLRRLQSYVEVFEGIRGRRELSKMCKSIARVFEVERSIKDFANVLQRLWRKKEVLRLKVLER